MQVTLILKHVCMMLLKGIISKQLTWKAFRSGRSMINGLLSWIPARAWDRFRFWKDCLTVRAPSESLVNKKVGQVNLTQLNPIDTILLEIASKGCLLRPSAKTASTCDGQFTHANFTRLPSPSTIHRESVCSGKSVTSLLWEITHWKIIRAKSRFAKEKRESLAIFGCVIEVSVGQVREQECKFIVLWVGDPW